MTNKQLQDASDDDLNRAVGYALGWRPFPYYIPTSPRGAGVEMWIGPGQQTHIRNAVNLPHWTSNIKITWPLTNVFHALSLNSNPEALIKDLWQASDADTGAFTGPSPEVAICKIFLCRWQKGNGEIDLTLIPKRSPEERLPDFVIGLTYSERDAILTGLRMLQESIVQSVVLEPTLNDILTDGDEHLPPTAEQIDRMCERINVGAHVFCDECGAGMEELPGDGMEGPWHRTSCSLYVAKAE